MGVQDIDQSLYQMKYQAAAAPNVVVSATPAFLHAIIIGKKVTNGVLEVSDHASDGDGNVKIFLENADAQTISIDAPFNVGIVADLTFQTNVTFFWR